MAGIREIARQYRDEIMDGIAWVAIWKEGKSWKAQAFWLNTDTDKIEDEDMSIARDIVAADANAIFINEYYCAHMGEGKLEEIVAGIKLFYEEGWNTLADSTAYEPGENFMEQEKREEIEETIRKISDEDKNWKWSVPIIRRTVIMMWWEYLKDEACEYFRIEYDEELDCFTAIDNYGEDITGELEDNTSLKATMRSVFWYASSRY